MRKKEKKMNRIPKNCGIKCGAHIIGILEGKEREKGAENYLNNG